MCPNQNCGPMRQNNAISNQVGLVVPTLCTRPEYLLQSLTSIKKSGIKHVVIVTPSPNELTGQIPDTLYSQIIIDQGLGLPNAINQGIISLPPSVTVAGWLGDDDVIFREAVTTGASYLLSNPATVAVFGNCEYIDSQSNVFWINKFGQLAVPLLKFGPNKIPQPGSFFTRDSYMRIGGLSQQYPWAFDQDLFHNLSKIGRVRYLPHTFAQYRWHKKSLSAGQIKNSMIDSARVRINHAPWVFRPISRIWENLHIRLALAIGSSLDRKSNLN